MTMVLVAATTNFTLVVSDTRGMLSSADSGGPKWVDEQPKFFFNNAGTELVGCAGTLPFHQQYLTTIKGQEGPEATATIEAAFKAHATSEAGVPVEAQVLQETFLVSGSSVTHFKACGRDGASADGLTPKVGASIVVGSGSGRAYVDNMAGFVRRLDEKQEDERFTYAGLHALLNLIASKEITVGGFAHAHLFKDGNWVRDFAREPIVAKSY